MNMLEAEIERGVKEIFLKTFEELSEGSFDFSKEQDQFQNWDSFSHMELVTLVEKRFGISLGMEEIVSVRTPGAFVEIVKKKLSK